MTEIDDKVHEGVWYEPIFRTEKGSIYYYNFDRGLWLRHRYDGELITRELNLGSIKEAPSSILEKLYWHEKLWSEGHVPGFVPKFVLGYDSYGLYFPHKNPIFVEDVIVAEKERIKLKCDLNKGIGFHYGHKITEVFREIDPLYPSK